MRKPALLLFASIAWIVLSTATASAQTCPSVSRTLPLVVNATTTVGSVSIVNDLVNTYVTATAIAPYTIDQLQVEVATSLQEIPIATTGGPQSSLFPYQATFPTSVSTYSFTSPLGIFVPGAQIVVAVHALVHQGTTCQQGSGSDDGEDDHEHEHDGAWGSGSSHNSSSGGSCQSGDHHGEHNSDDDGHCSATADDNTDHYHPSSLSGHSQSRTSSKNHGDDHHGDDHHGDSHSGDHHGEDDSSHEHNCSCSQQSAWAGNLLFPTGTTETYFFFTVNCGVPE